MPSPHDSDLHFAEALAGRAGELLTASYERSMKVDRKSKRDVVTDVDYASEPTTLVSFELEQVKEGTMLTVVESGFDKIPAARRGEAYGRNEGGWTIQMQQIEEYVSKAG